MADLPTIIKSAKIELRQIMRARLAALSPEQMAEGSNRLCQYLKSWLASQKGNCVALFGGMAGEPDLLPLIPWLRGRGGKAVFFGFDPATGLVPQEVGSEQELTRGPFGVWMPGTEAPRVPIAELDTILVPGLAFDTSGHRLGRGRGYFDRLFSDPECKATKLAVCFAAQVVPEVPVEPHDVTVDGLLTDEGW